MSRTKLARRRWRHWFNPVNFLDGWFTLLERMRASLERLLDHGFLLKKRSTYERKPSYFPQCEDLERRMLMSTVFLHAATQSVNYNATYAVLEADLSATSSLQIKVNYGTADGTASAGTDYTSTSGTLTFPPGASSETFLVPMLNHKQSSNKNFTASLSSPTNATLGSPQTDTVTIVETPLTSNVVDLNADIVLPSNGTPVDTFSNWGMKLAAEISGAAASSYSWSLSQPSYAGTLFQSTKYNPSFTWSSFSGAATRSDTLTLTAVLAIAGSSGSEELIQNIPFTISSTSSAATSGISPTTTSTWPSLPNGVGPDQLNGQDTIAAGPYAVVGLVDGSAQTGFTMPLYNTNADPIGLVYNSAVADPLPTFIVSYQLDATKSLPSYVKAQLTVNGTAGSWIYFDPTSFNPGETMQIAIQATAAMLPTSTGHYSWQILTTANYSPNVTATFTGEFNFINGSTTPTSLTANPFGVGWSVANVEHLWVVSGTYSGVIVQNPDGTSLWFKSNGGGAYQTPPGDFTTMTSSGGVYTRTMPDGTTITFNSSGQETNITDSNGNTTTFAYSGSGQLTTITAATTLVNVIAYDGTSGLATSLTDPDSRIATLTYSSSNLTSITDANSKVWTYSYDSAHRLTALQDPRGSAYTTTFNYNYASQVSTVNQPDGTTQTFAAEQLAGMAAQGTGTSSISLATGTLAAAAFGTYTDPNGKTWTEYFDGLGFGLPVETVDPLGDTALTYRDSNGLPWLVADALGRRDRIFYSAGTQNITTYVFADDNYDVSSNYNSFGEAQNYKDASGGLTTMTYDSSGNLLTLDNALGNTTTYSYTSSGIKGLVATVTEPLAASHSGLYTTTYQYDSHGELTTMLQALTTSTNLTQTWSYTNGLVSAYTDANTHTTSYTYDNLGNMLTEVLPQGSGVNATETFAYDAVGNLTTVVNALTTATSATTVYSYDKMNRLTQIQDPRNKLSTYSYDSAGNQVGVTNALGYTTTYSVDNASRVTAVTIPLTAGSSATTTYVLDAAGELTAVTNALSKTANYTYNARGWLSTVTDPAGNSTSYGYNAVGDTTTVTRNNSVTTTATYYSLHLLKTTTDALSDVTTYNYDADNNLTNITDFNQNITTLTYDALDRPVTQNYDGDITTYAMDNNSNVTSSTDPLGNVSTYTFDYQNRLLTSVNADTATITATTSFLYNLAGWQTAITDPDGNTTSYAFNADGSLATTTNANGHTSTYSYDDAGQLTAMTDFNGSQMTYTYNQAGWQTGETRVGGSYAATFSYDNAGEMTVASDTNSTYTFTYNSDGSLKTTAISYPGASSMGTVTLSYSYDAFGNRTSLTDKSGTTLIYTATYTYAYNNNFQVTTMTFADGTANATVAYSYGTSGTTHDLLTTMAMVDSSETLTAAYSYDSQSRLTTIAYSDVTHINVTFGYAYNSGNQVTQSTGPEGTVTYTYDKAGQLTAVTGAETYTYSYDANGNRKTSSVTTTITTTTTYTTTINNELTSTTGGLAETIAYDNKGNVTSVIDGSGDTWTYTWDTGCNCNHMTQAVETTSTMTINTVVYTYDMFDDLIGESVNGTATWHIFDGSTNLATVNSSGSVTAQNLTDPTTGANLGTVSSGTVDYSLTDLISTVREIVTGTGTVVGTTNLDPFGNVTSSTGTAGALGFQGAVADPTTGLDIMGARLYDPGTGEFISQDPLGFDGGSSNLYSFVANQPTDQTDKSGMDGIPAIVDNTTGKLEFSGEVQGQVLNGKVNVFTGRNVTITDPITGKSEKTGGNIELGFESTQPIPTDGKGNSNVHFLQFGKRTLFKGNEAVKGDQYFPTAIPGFGQAAFLKTNTWCVDSSSNKNNPWYEQNSFYSLGGKNLSIFDSPNAGLDKDVDLQKGLGDGVTKVVDEYHTYLVMNGKAYYKLSWTSTWSLQDGKWGRTYSNITGKGINDGLALNNLDGAYAKNEQGQFIGTYWGRAKVVNGVIQLLPNGPPETFGLSGPPQ